MNDIALLSATVGLPVFFLSILFFSLLQRFCCIKRLTTLPKNHQSGLKCYLKDSGAYLERRVAGLRSVRVQDKYFTNYNWGYQVLPVAAKTKCQLKIMHSFLHSFALAYFNHFKFSNLHRTITLSMATIHVWLD